MKHLLVSVTMASAVLLAPTARADKLPPVIAHTPLGSCPTSPAPGQPAPPCVVDANITDKDGVFDPTLLVRLKGVQAYERVPMKPVKDAKDTFRAEVPPTLVVAGAIEYLIEAFDNEGNGPARAGDEANPLVLEQKAPPSTDQNNGNGGDEVKPPPEDNDDNTGLIIGVVAGVSAAVVLVGLGVGVAVYALRPPAPTEVGIIVNAPSPLALQVRR